MAFKQFELDDIGTVTVYKRKGARNLRLTMTSKGEVKVTIPSWSPFNAGVAFAKHKSAWIVEHRPAKKEPLKTGDQVGKAHRLVFLQTLDKGQPTSHIRGTEIRIRHARTTPADHPAVQEVAERAALRALRLEAKKLLPIRTQEIAQKYGYRYTSINVKTLKSRWGSCDQHKNLIFNIYLMQLPWHLIDYVILHELAHTKVLRHGEPFWREMERFTPNAKSLRNQMREYQPILRLKP